MVSKTPHTFSSSRLAAITPKNSPSMTCDLDPTPEPTPDVSSMSSRSTSPSPPRFSSRHTLGSSASESSDPSSPVNDDESGDPSKLSDLQHAETLASALGPIEETTEKEMTVSFEEAKVLMPWQMDNGHIRSGYRRPTPSFKGCAWSIIGYLHNESVNILTHLIGAAAFLTLLPIHLIPDLIPSIHPAHRSFFDHVPHTLHDKVALAVYLLAAVTCLGLSATFHTLSCHSKDVSEVAHRGDYIGIIVLIVGSICPGMYYAFHGQLFWQITYITLITTAGLISGFVVLSPHHRSNRWPRILTFIGLGLTACIPTAHVLLTQGHAHARSVMSLDLICLGGATYILGAFIYGTRFPEVLSPGTFDHFGSSHQIFHVLVVIGAFFQYLALRGMVFGRAAAVGQAMAEADAAAAAVADDRWDLIAKVAIKGLIKRIMA
ncbi:hypothetical protein IAU59_000710 [Kwoniella sp. CBS 9459]